jgi:cell division protein YceG involved in septum cleavage
MENAQVVTMASLIEKEAGIEHSLVSAVFHNRLRNMRLNQIHGVYGSTHGSNHRMI